MLAENVRHIISVLLATDRCARESFFLFEFMFSICCLFFLLQTVNLCVFLQEKSFGVKSKTCGMCTKCVNVVTKYVFIDMVRCRCQLLCVGFPPAAFAIDIREYMMTAPSAHSTSYP